MEQTENGLERLYNGRKNLEYLMEKTEDRELNDKDNLEIENISQYKEHFISAMEDDLNTADAISAIFELVKYTNTNIDEQSNKKVVERAYSILRELTGVLGILSKEDEILEDEIMELIEKRTEARKNKDYKLSDEIRDLLKDKGIILEDTQDGVKWKRV
jgi:cysteinyl-tRNA synthetase